MGADFLPPPVADFSRSIGADVTEADSDEAERRWYKASNAVPDSSAGCVAEGLDLVGGFLRDAIGNADADTEDANGRVAVFGRVCVSPTLVVAAATTDSAGKADLEPTVTDEDDSLLCAASELDAALPNTCS